MSSFLWNTLCFLLAIGLLVAIHELGHFLAARAMGVRVLRFSIGFGPLLASRKGADGCEYALSLIPLGGYVKMLDEGTRRGGAPEAGVEEGSFRAQRPWRRAVIIAAGPFFNLVLAVALYFVINLNGITVVRPMVGDVIPGRPAAAAGFEPQDLIASVAGEEVHDWQETLLALASRAGEPAVEVGVRRGPGGEALSLRLDLGGFDLDPRTDPLDTIGLRRCVGLMDGSVEAVRPGSPADHAGIRAGDRIVMVDGRPTPNFYRLQDEIARAGASVTARVERDGKVYETVIHPEVVGEGERTRRLIGVQAHVSPLPELLERREYGVADGLAKALGDTVHMSLLVVRTAVKLANGTISAGNISGPIAIARGAGGTASAGLLYFIGFLAAISVNLGVLNLIPIPVLDGGQLLFIAYEALARRPPSPRIEMFLSSLGFSLLMMLMLLAVFNDIRAL
ncbi:MAG: RIP metalloprotease RseP [Succinivibrionaceae bacterium]|nr:RIP metalloprotease RseP [Succinivibrionaceae bacterium]